MQASGEPMPWERAATDPFEPPQTTRLVPVGPARPTTRHTTEEPDFPDDGQGPTANDVDDAQAPIFAADTMRPIAAREPAERASFVGHSIGRPDFAAPQRVGPSPRPPASAGDQGVSPTLPEDLVTSPAEARGPGQAELSVPFGSSAPPPWVSTSSARRVGAPKISSDGQPGSAAVVVRIELVIVDQTGRDAPSGRAAAEPATEIDVPDVAEADAVPDAAARETPAVLDANTKLARSSAPVRAAMRIVGVLALLGIGLLLVQLGAWLAR